ncbi:hypothetical protein BOO71_0003424 [Deinococcus marmoris]|uniref:IrrE N-terminal-like domain-containing protein n=1 Tax=Deinococcus marmoris TaxID=249408 RepID=A0A1U7P217_9DEIO|nr:hypothetical protein BOO71_0003424 [Deinococcus marmoris]
MVCTGLTLSPHISLDERNAEYFAGILNVVHLRSALRKAMGILNRRTSEIYTNAAMNPAKNNFVILHEVGHQAMPWQRGLAMHYDDTATLSDDTHNIFEREANLFAADTLFQLERFATDAADLPLGLSAVLQLAGRYRASVHASLRRYVESSFRPCFAFVLSGQPILQADAAIYPVVTTHESPEFTFRFPTWTRPQQLPAAHPMFARVSREKLIDMEYAEFTLVEDGTAHDAIAHLFYNGHHLLVLLIPRDITGRARRRIVQTRR